MLNLVAIQIHLFSHNELSSSSEIQDLLRGYTRMPKVAMVPTYLSYLRYLCIQCCTVPYFFTTSYGLYHRISVKLCVKAGKAVDQIEPSVDDLAMGTCTYHTPKAALGLFSLSIHPFLFSLSVLDDPTSPTQRNPLILQKLRSLQTNKKHNRQSQAGLHSNTML